MGVRPKAAPKSPAYPRGNRHTEVPGQGIDTRRFRPFLWPIQTHGREVSAVEIAGRQTPYPEAPSPQAWKVVKLFYIKGIQY